MYITRGVRYGTVRGYVLLGMGTVCRYVLLGTVRYGYGTWVRYMGTVRGYGVLVQCTHRTCFQEMWCYFQNVALIAAHFGNSTTFPQNRYGGYTVPVRRTYGPYPRTVPVPYPHRTRIVPIPSVRTHGTYPPYVPVPMPKSYPVLGSPGTR